MAVKKNLPPGIYINHEYPAHIKHARDKLHPILQLAKNIPQYRDKSKLEDDHLVINGISYMINDLASLPTKLAAYKAAEKSNEDTIVFQVELSPWSRTSIMHCLLQMDSNSKHLNTGSNTRNLYCLVIQEQWNLFLKAIHPMKPRN